MKGSKQFYFTRVKALLLQNQCLATHWSLSHTGCLVSRTDINHCPSTAQLSWLAWLLQNNPHTELVALSSVLQSRYHSVVAYCYLPSATKPLSQLDPTPYVWAADGQHPSLAEASRKPVNAKGVAAYRRINVVPELRLAVDLLACFFFSPGCVIVVKQGACDPQTQVSKAEQRFQDIDVWPIVVQQNILVGDASRDQLMAYAKRCGGAPMVKYCFTNWAKLPDLIERAWAAETVETQVEEHAKSRVDKLLEGAAEQCTCDGRWATAAEASAP